MTEANIFYDPLNNQFIDKTGKVIKKATEEEARLMMEDLKEDVPERG